MGLLSELLSALGKPRIYVWSLVLFCTILFPATADAQHMAFESGPDPVLQEESGGPEASVEFFGRISAFTGEVDSNIAVDYDDLFGTGYGFILKGSLHWDLEDLHLGPYVSVGWDQYSGKSHTDGLGDTLEADNLEMLTVLAGLKLDQALDYGLYWGGHIGLGLAQTSSVDGGLTLSGIPLQVEIFKKTAVYAFDIGFHGGYSADSIYVEMGVGVSLQGSPDESDLNFSRSSYSSDPAVPYFALGIGFRF